MTAVLFYAVAVAFFAYSAFQGDDAPEWRSMISLGLAWLASGLIWAHH